MIMMMAWPWFNASLAGKDSLLAITVMMGNDDINGDGDIDGNDDTGGNDDANYKCFNLQLTRSSFEAYLRESELMASLGRNPTMQRLKSIERKFQVYNCQNFHFSDRLSLS